MSSYLPVLARRSKRWEEQFVDAAAEGGFRNLRAGSRKVKRFVRKGVPGSHRAKVSQKLK